MPTRPRSHQLEDQSRRAFAGALPVSWVLRHGTSDYGVDATVEIFDGTAATGRLFNVQLKATDEPELGKALTSIRFGLGVLEYYRSLALPLLVVLYHAPTKRLYQQWLHAYDPLARGGQPLRSDAKTMALRFLDCDAWTEETPTRIDAAVRGFFAFRNPELALPLRLGVSSEVSVSDALRVTFNLREALTAVSDLVLIEHRAVAGDEPAVLLTERSARVTLADVASVTLSRDPDALLPPTLGADLGVALARALVNVGQANLAAQIAAATAPASAVITDFEVSMPLAGAMVRARRAREAIELSDELDASGDDGRMLAANTFRMAVLAMPRLTDSERALALDVAERRRDRRLQRGERAYAGAEAYSMAMLHKRGQDGAAAIRAFSQALELDPRYADRAYFHRDLAGALFETGRPDEAADAYARAIELGDIGLVEALYADALMFAGRYAAAQAQFDHYLATDRGSEDGEWRLKRAILPMLRRWGGDCQQRASERASALTESVDLTDPALTIDKALDVLTQALRADACCGEAWFRYAFVEPASRSAVEFPLGPALAGAVLLRYASGAWINASTAADMEGSLLLPDILQTAYRYERDEFVRATLESTETLTDPDAHARRLSLLEEAVRRQSEIDRRQDFVMRFVDDNGGVEELVVGA